jgi:hypothetical protein
LGYIGLYSQQHTHRTPPRSSGRNSQSNLYIRLPFFSLFCVSAACAIRFTFFPRAAPPFFEKWGAVHISGELGGWCRLERCKRDIIGGLCGHHAGRWCSLRPELHLCKRVRGRSCFIYRVVLRCWLRGVCAKINKLCEMLTLDCSCVKGRGRSRRSQSNLYIRLPFFSLFCVSAACAARFTFFSRTAPPFFEKWGAVHKSGELGGAFSSTKGRKRPSTLTNMVSMATFHVSTLMLGIHEVHGV